VNAEKGFGHRSKQKKQKGKEKKMKKKKGTVPGTDSKKGGGEPWSRNKKKTVVVVAGLCWANNAGCGLPETSGKDGPLGMPLRGGEPHKKTQKKGKQKETKGGASVRERHFAEQRNVRWGGGGHHNFVDGGMITKGVKYRRTYQLPKPCRGTTQPITPNISGKNADPILPYEAKGQRAPPYSCPKARYFDVTRKSRRIIEKTCPQKNDKKGEKKKHSGSPDKWHRRTLHAGRQYRTPHLYPKGDGGKKRARDQPSHISWETRNQKKGQ